MLSRITHHALRQPDTVALKGVLRSYTYQELNSAVFEIAKDLAQYPDTSRLAIAMDNCPEWMILDLAALALAMPVIPLPAFFSDHQLQHAIFDAGVNLIITDTPHRYSAILGDHINNTQTIEIGDMTLSIITTNTPQTKLYENCAKITYTSGTTGNPKGVCLSKQSMLNVAHSVQKQTETSANDHHLCVLPLSTLLENVAGVYASLIAGGTIHLYPSSQIGFTGSEFDIKALHQSLLSSQASTAILIPELLKALILYCGSGAEVPSSLRFLAVGGAHVSTDLLNRALRIGLPVYEGYGLSESASVTTLNIPQAHRIGSVGKALPHVHIKLNLDNEIMVKGANLLGYMHQAIQTDDEGYIATGDIGYCDNEGYWFIQGRKKNIFITSFGRNVSPEWVESQLTQLPNIMQACVFGEAKPFNTALILKSPQSTEALIEESIALVNAQLPDYARVSRYILMDTPFTTNNGQLTTNGRLKREAIWLHYHEQINVLYALSTA